MSIAVETALVVIDSFFVCIYLYLLISFIVFECISKKLREHKRTFVAKFVAVLILCFILQISAWGMWRAILASVTLEIEKSEKTWHDFVGVCEMQQYSALLGAPPLFFQQVLLDLFCRLAFFFFWIVRCLYNLTHMLHIQNNIKHKKKTDIFLVA